VRLGFHELAGSLKKGLSSIYLVSGDEPLQQLEAADLIRTTARDAGYADRKILDASNNFDWNELTAEANSLSLFAELRIIDLRITNGKPGTEGSKALTAYCENPPQDTLLLITMPKLDQQQTRSKWYKSIDSKGMVIQVWPVNEQRLPPWIEQRMRQKSLTPEPGVINMLADRVEGNLLAATQEIEKLLLLYGPGIITTEQMTASVADSARFDVFGLIDAALMGNTNRCLRILDGLKHEGTPTAVILWALAREVRQMAQIAFQASDGMPLSKVFADHRIWEKRKPLINKALKKLSPKQWQNLLKTCHEADLAVKGQRKSDPWLLFEDIAITMSGHPAPVKLKA
jgi:DNA polymerase III subunit delta